MKLKEMKKRKVMKSLQKEVRIEVSTSKYYDVIFKKMQIKRLRKRIEFTVNQLRQVILEQKENWQSRNSMMRACYAHIHRLSIALRCSQTTRSRDQIIMWLNSEWKFMMKWSTFTIHRSSIASWCSQTIQNSFSLLN